MSHKDLHHAGADTLAQVMRLGQSHHVEWAPDDLAQMLEHLLSSDLALELTSLDQVSAEMISQVASSGDRPLQTIRDVLTDPNPPHQLLNWLKQYARTKSARHSGPLPTPVASVLYFASIVSARLRCQTTLTTFDDATVIEAIRWALDQSWLEPTLTSLFQDGLRVYNHRT